MWTPNASRRRALDAAVILCTLGLLSACAGSSSELTASRISTERPAADAPAAELPPPTDDMQPAPGEGATPSDDAFCDRVEGFATDPAGPEGDTAGFLESLRGLAAVAPAELADEFRAVIGWFEALDQVDPSDPSALEQMFRGLFDADAAEAFQAIVGYTIETCEVGLVGPGSPSPFD
jgi:hypothetical protein